MLYHFVYILSFTSCSHWLIFFTIWGCSVQLQVNVAVRRYFAGILCLSSLRGLRWVQVRFLQPQWQVERCRVLVVVFKSAVMYISYRLLCESIYTSGLRVVLPYKQCQPIEQGFANQIAFLGGQPRECLSLSLLVSLSILPHDQYLESRFVHSNNGQAGSTCYETLRE